MRQDKSLLRISGRPIIEHVCAQLRPHFKEILVSTNEPDKQAFLGMKTVPDEVPGLGPLMGIASALEASRYDRNFVVACDVPIMDVTLIRRMMRAVKRHDAAAPETPGGRLEPLFAVYRKRILGPIRAALAAGELGVRDVLSRCNVARVPLSGAEAPVNLNTPEDYAQFVAPRGGKE
jgi:molybdopterin-guanine dinucleotide biosynthesis protein A